MSDLLNVRMSELRTCRGPCGETKPLVEGFYRNMGTYYKYRCKACHIAANREGRARQKDAPRIVKQPPLIPASDPWLDLQVVEACWQSCVDEGPPAITRMVKKIATVTKNLPGGERLRVSATAYLNGELSLELVRTQLDELVALAVAS